MARASSLGTWPVRGDWKTWWWCFYFSDTFDGLIVIYRSHLDKTRMMAFATWCGVVSRRSAESLRRIRHWKVGENLKRTEKPGVSQLFRLDHSHAYAENKTHWEKWKTCEIDRDRTIGGQWTFLLGHQTFVDMSRNHTSNHWTSLGTFCGPSKWCQLGRCVPWTATNEINPPVQTVAPVVTTLPSVETETINRRELESFRESTDLGLDGEQQSVPSVLATESWDLLVSRSPGEHALPHTQPTVEVTASDLLPEQFYVLDSVVGQLNLLMRYLTKFPVYCQLKLLTVHQWEVYGTETHQERSGTYWKG